MLKARCILAGEDAQPLANRNLCKIASMDKLRGSYWYKLASELLLTV